MARKSLKEKIKDVLRKYFQYDDKGHQNKDYNPIYSAQDTIEKIKEIVGEI